MNFMDLKQGDQLFYVPNDFRFGRTASLKTVTKVGRKYVYLDGSKIEPWSYDGFAIAHMVDHPYGTVYASESDYMEMHEWRAFLASKHETLNREQRRALLDFVKSLGGAE